MVRKSMHWNFGSIRGLESDDVLNLIKTILRDTFIKTKDDLLEASDKVIPKDTGLMRQTVEKNIKKSSVDATGYTVEMFFGANELPYTKDVEKMETTGNPHVRHPPHNNKTTERKGNYDPEAEGHPFQWMAEYCKYRLEFNWESSKIDRVG